MRLTTTRCGIFDELIDEPVRGCALADNEVRGLLGFSGLLYSVGGHRSPLQTGGLIQLVHLCHKPTQFWNAASSTFTGQSTVCLGVVSCH